MYSMLIRKDLQVMRLVGELMRILILFQLSSFNAENSLFGQNFGILDQDFVFTTQKKESEGLLI